MMHACHSCYAGSTAEVAPCQHGIMATKKTPVPSNMQAIMDMKLVSVINEVRLTLQTNFICSCKRHTSSL